MAIWIFAKTASFFAKLHLRYFRSVLHWQVQGKKYWPFAILRRKKKIPKTFQLGEFFTCVVENGPYAKKKSRERRKG